MGAQSHSQSKRIKLIIPGARLAGESLKVDFFPTITTSLKKKPKKPLVLTFFFFPLGKQIDEYIKKLEEKGYNFKQSLISKSDLSQ